MVDNENKDDTNGATTRRSVLKGSASVGMLGIGTGVGRADDGPSSAGTGDERGGKQVEPHQGGQVGTLDTGSGDSVLIVKDCEPWYVPANEYVLESMGVSYTVINSGSLDGRDLSSYTAVVLPSTQSGSYYRNLADAKGTLSNYVENGGTLVAHVTDGGYPCTAEWSESFLPDGVGHVQTYRDNLTAAVPSHPVVEGISDGALDGWNSSTHGYLTNLPSSATTLIGVAGDVGDKPTYAEYGFGDGRVLASTQTLEWPWSPSNSGYGTKRLLQNELKYAIEGSPPGEGTPDSFDALKDRKRALADNIDANGLGYLSDRDQVDPALAGLTDAVDAGDLSLDDAKEAVDRMGLGEEVTDAVVAGAGPGESEHVNGSLNVSKLTAEYAVNPVLEIIFAGITVVKAAKIIPFVGGAADRAAKAAADFVADLAGRFNRSLEQLIRARGKEAGFAILGAVEKRSKKEGKAVATEEFKKTKEAQGALFIEDSSEVIFRDFLFSEEYDLNDEPTTPLDDSLNRLVEDLDASPEPEFEGSGEAAADANKRALEDVNGIYSDVEDALTDGLIASILQNIGILELVLSLVAVIAGVTGVLAVPGAVAGVAAGLLGLGVGTALSLAQWGTGTVGILSARFRHMIAVQEIVDPTGVQ